MLPPVIGQLLRRPFSLSVASPVAIDADTRRIGELDDPLAAQAVRPFPSEAAAQQQRCSTKSSTNCCSSVLVANDVNVQSPFIPFNFIKKLAELPRQTQNEEKRFVQLDRNSWSAFDAFVVAQFRRMGFLPRSSLPQRASGKIPVGGFPPSSIETTSPLRRRSFFSLGRRALYKQKPRRQQHKTTTQTSCG